MAEVDFPFPIRGLDENWPYTDQPALTSPDMLNVRPYSTDEERARGGQRPGVTRAYNQQIGGSSTPIQWLGWLDIGFGDTVLYTDEFEYANGQLSTATGSNWTSANANLHAYAGTIKPNVIGDGTSITTYSSGNHADIVSSSDTWDDFELSTRVDWSFGEVNGKAVYSFGIDGGGSYDITVELTATELTQPTTGGSAYLGFAKNLYIYTSGGGKYNETLYPLLHTTGAALDIRVQNGKATIFYNGKQIISESVSSSNTYDSASFALGASNPTNGSSFGSEWIPDSSIIWRLQYWRMTAITRNTTISKELVALAGRDVWAESTEGTTMAAVTSSDTLANVAQYSASHCNGLLFILDGTQPQYYNPVANSVSDWGPREGEIVSTCTIIANWRNRLCLSGSKDDPHNIFMSRLDDPFDFDYGRADSLSAVALNTTNLGRIGEPVQALVPVSDNQLVIGCSRSVWRLSGDPMYGGQLYKLTSEGGISGQNAWTMDDRGTVYYFGEHGLFALPPGGRPEPLTDRRVPDLSGYKPVSGAGADGEYYITVEYDAARDGILIYLTPFTSGAATHYFYDLRTNGFFPESYANAMGPTCSAFYNAKTPSYRTLLLGGRNGYLYKYDDDTKNDVTDGSTTAAISSNVLLQPRRLSGRFGQDAVLQNIRGVLSDDSDGATYSVLAAETAEGVKDATAFATGTWSSGRNDVSPYRIRGGAHGIQISNTTASESWAMESVTAEAFVGGFQR